MSATTKLNLMTGLVARKGEAVPPPDVAAAPAPAVPTSQPAAVEGAAPTAAAPVRQAKPKATKPVAPTPPAGTAIFGGSLAIPSGQEYHKALTLKLDKERFTRLKMLGVMTGRTSQVMLVEALDLWLKAQEPKGQGASS